MKRFFVRMKGTKRDLQKKPLSEIMWSGIGAFLGIYAISAFGQCLEPSSIASLFLIGSFGASAVLVYGAPMAEFSQPRSLVGGHLVSAIIGVTVFKLMGEYPMLASPIAVSLAIAIMHLTHTLHPPGGATALIAVSGGHNIHLLGYNYVFCPVFVGALTMLVVALLVNNLSANPKRHYPVHWR